MNYFSLILLLIYGIKFSKEQKIVEINFYKNTSIKNESDFSELITNKLYVTFEVGSSKRKVDLQLYFSSPYFTISDNDVENSSSYKPLEPDYNFYDKSEFYMARKSEEKIKINEKITIDDFKFISDKLGSGKLGLNLNCDNNELIDFIFIKELLRNKLIDSQDIKIIFNNNNNFSSGKIIFGLSPNYTIPMHVEERSIFCFRIDQIIYQGEDYTAEIGIDFNSAGIVVPSTFYKKVEEFFEPYIKSNLCKYIVIPRTFESSIFCYDNFTQIEKFGNISFIINDFNFLHTFVLEAKELFLKVKGGYLFLIRSFAFYTGENWVLGLPFFRKYPVTFNLKKKLIGFDINKENNIGDKSNNNSLVAWILLGILGLLFILIISFNIYFFIYKRKRKIRANELDENIVYKEKNDEDNKLGI